MIKMYRPYFITLILAGAIFAFVSAVPSTLQAQKPIFANTFVVLDKIREKQSTIKLDLRFARNYQNDLEKNMVAYISAVEKKEKKKQKASAKKIKEIWQSCQAKQQGLQELFYEWTALKQKLEKAVNTAVKKVK